MASPVKIALASRRSNLLLLLFCSVASLVTSATASVQKSAGAKSSQGPAPRTKARPDAARFAARAQTILATANASSTYWGALVLDRDTGKVLYELNSDHFFAPASNAKNFTTALALSTLGRTYQFRTTLESSAALGADGRLAGDLVLVGRGDPDLSNRAFPYAGSEERSGPIDKSLIELADAAVAKGLREIDGNIVADDSYLPYDPYPAGWTTGDLFFDFGAPVSAIAFNENVFGINVQVGANAGDPAIVSTAPVAALPFFNNDVMTGAAGSKLDFAVVRQPGDRFLLLRGSIPLGHAAAHLDMAMNDPAEIAGEALKDLLEERGVRVTGNVRVQHAPPPYSDAAGAPRFPPLVPETPGNPVGEVIGNFEGVEVRSMRNPPSAASVGSALIFAEHLSPPLLESVRLTNKISQNLHAELFLRTVGREKFGIGSTAAGLAIEKTFLKSAGINSSEVILSDGSGLSRDDLVTPHALVAILNYAAQQPWGADFISTLPIAGTDGTLENRMKNTAAVGRIQAKTGSLEHVHSMSGYATTLRGEHLVFAFFGNNDPVHGPDAAKTIDALGVAMVETLGISSPAAKHPK